MVQYQAGFTAAHQRLMCRNNPEDKSSKAALQRPDVSQPASVTVLPRNGHRTTEPSNIGPTNINPTFIFIPGDYEGNNPLRERVKLWYIRVKNQGGF